MSSSLKGKGPNAWYRNEARVHGKVWGDDWFIVIVVILVLAIIARIAG